MRLAEVLLWSEPRSARRALVMTAAAVAIALAGKPSSLSIDGSRLDEGHGILSLDLAIASAYCGQSSAFAHAVRIPHLVAADMSLRSTSLRALVVSRAGSVEEYCRQVDTPFVNSENSLMRLEAAILRLAPELSLEGLAQVLYWIKLSCIAIFVFWLMSVGASLALGIASFLCGVMLLQAMPDHVYSTYPFFFCLVLLALALHGLAVRWAWTQSIAGQLAFGTIAGLLGAFVVNMRTSYLPVVVSFLACVLIDRWRKSAAAGRFARAAAAAIVTVSFVAGFAIMQAGVITRGLPADRYNASHPFAHPLVLALAVPENAFSRDMGIEWADAAGPRLAARVDPGVPFLGPRYNAALMSFYRSLWRDHTREMVGVYWMKFSVAGANMIQVLRASPGVAGLAVNILLAPLALLPNGILLMVLWAGLTAGAFAIYVRDDSPAAFGIGLLSLAAVLMQIETGVIFSVFVKQYHNYSAFYVLFISLLGVQGLANLAWARIGRRTALAATT